MAPKVNWKPESGKSLPTNTPVNVDPKLNTITVINATGFVPMRPVLPGEPIDNVPHYSIANTGRVLYKFGPGNIFSFEQYSTINEFADAARKKYGANAATEIINFRNYAQNELTVRAKNVGIIDPQKEPAPKDRPSGESEDNTETEVGSPDSGSDNTPANIFGVTINEFYKEGTLNSQQTSQNLSYPKDMDASQDRIVITQRKYISVEESGTLSDDFYKKIQSDRFATPPSQIIGSVVLPMPNDISETNVTAWGENSLSSLAAMLGGAALSGVSNVSMGRFGEFGADVSNLATNITGDAAPIIRQLLTLNAAAAITRKVGINIDPEAFRSRITGTAINPNLELLFQGPKLRSFGFQFKLAPRSAPESENIRKIVKFFKKGMAPLRSTEGAAAFFLGAPMVFDIQFKNGSGELKGIGKIKTCALQQCVVNYTPDGIYNSYEDDSQPVALTLQLGFTELLPLYNDDYNYDNDNVGWDPKPSTQS